MTTGEKKPSEASPASKGKASFIALTVLIVVLFTGAIAFGVQAMLGAGQEPNTGVLVDGAVREFHINVKEWSYEPAVIKVNPGEKVKFIVSSADVWHGFAINELGVNEAIPGGQTVTKEVVIPRDVTDRVYTMYCSVFCGLGHPYLKGRLIIGEPKLFLGIGLGRSLPYMATMAMAAVFAAFVIIGGRKVR